MKPSKWLFPLLAATLLCIAGITSLEAGQARHFRAGQLTVMTQNLYVGGDILLPLSVPPEQFPAAAAQVVAQILATNFRERAMQLGDLIRGEQPHLIGLQEVYDIRICLAASPSVCPVDLDYLQILLDNLNGGNERYAAVASVTNIDLPSLPASVPGLGDVTISLTDRDVILARNDVETEYPTGSNYTVGLPVDSPFLPAGFTILRGYAMVDATVNGREYRFVNTHLEITGEGSPLEPFFRAVQAAQIAELAAILATDDHTQIVVGDFNSDPNDGPIVTCGVADGQGGASFFDCPTPYLVMLQATYVDVWNERNGPWSEGLTCCQAADLSNPVSALDERIDQIWVRQAPDHYGGPILRGVQAEVIGEEVKDKTVTGLWPSDHAGVAARMTLRTPK